MGWHDPARNWRSGPWSLELRDDELADIAFGGRVALRSIRAVVRDRDWDTAALVVDDVTEDAGSLLLHVHTADLGAALSGTLRVDASADALSADLHLTAHRAFATNRTGLVVLHPPAAAGAPLLVRHADGSHEDTRFPRRISPHQPVLDIAGLVWRSGGLDVDVRFAGDVFEMEDQRNWTDASFKTYSRPLARPFPYDLAAGERVRQRVEVRVRAAAGASVPDRDVIELDAGGVFPGIQLGAATAPDPAPAVAAIGDAVLVELDLATRSWPAALARAAASGLPLDVRFVLADDAPDAIRAGALALHGIPLARVAAFAAAGPAAHVSDAAAIAALRDALAQAGITAPVVGGARSHFTELNRERHRLPDDLDGIVFSLTPLFHSRGTEQLVESVAMQRLIAEQAVGDAAGRPVHIGPVTLRPRFNNVATTPPPTPTDTDLRAGYGPHLIDADDARQDAPELAAWTIAGAAALAVPGVASLTYFEEWGPRGIRRADGTDRPVAAALRALASLSGMRLLHGASPDGLVWAIGAGSSGGDETVLVANLDRRPRPVTVRTTGATASIALDAGGWAQLRTVAEVSGG